MHTFYSGCPRANNNILNNSGYWAGRGTGHEAGNENGYGAVTKHGTVH